MTKEVNVQDKHTNRNLWIIFLVALVNMLGYGIIIPIIYEYSRKFGLSDFQNGLLVAIYSLCQFISTPIIGRLSDKYGRRPMLILSISGTAVSFFMLAFAPSAIFLFIARALDGITAGNIPVALAVVSDITKPQNRAAAFGRVGSAFSFGFVFGPAISAATVGIWQPLPFVIAGVITLIAVALAAIYLPETNANLGQVKNEKLFDIPKLWHTLFDPRVGKVFLITLVYYLAFATSIVYGFNPYSKNVLGLSDTMNAVLFTLFGVVGLISQNFLVGPFTKYFGMKNAFSIALLFSAIPLIIMGNAATLIVFGAGAMLLALFNSVSQTLIPTMLSQSADENSQGSIMGLNASYQSIGMIFGPILGGAIATVNISLAFIVGAGLVLLCFLFSSNLIRSGRKVSTV
jgi:predicted MFS family arabinose efflux permease